MKKILADNDIDFKKPVIACLGVFDGFHLAHLKIINKTLKIAKENNFSSLFFTFKLPKNLKKFDSIYFDDLKFNILSNEFTFDYYYEFNLIKNLNMDKIYFLNFLKNKFNIKKVVVGNDYRFGKGRTGNIKDLQLFFGSENIYNLEIIKINNNLKLSSSYIKNLLIDNNFSDSNKYLYKNYHCVGIVVRGKQVARTLGFPTANINLDDKLVIHEGTYLGKTIYKDKSYPSMIYYDKIKNKIESHIIDQNFNLYDKFIEVYFLEFLEGKELIRNKKEAIIKLQRCYNKSVDYFQK